jgi:hypothetical protein
LGIGVKEKEQAGGGNWLCGRCDRPLELCKVQVTYLGSVFSLDLLKCPGCGAVVVTEEIAAGKMAEAEQILEDK